ncbi:MAG: hypothetical protein IJI37_02825 [Opitutales bacterium]|nr:hypothetical protein [Opitutales bacterium]
MRERHCILRILKAAALLSAALSADARATEVVAGKGDTFISQAFPSGEFSKSEFLALSRDPNEKTISYLPFEFDAAGVGLNPERDAVNTATLTLFVKHFPELPKSNAVGSGGTTDLTPAVSASDPAVAAEKIAENAEEKIENADKDIVRIEVFGVVDGETFEANSKNYRVSWDGKHDAPAPKHNGVDDNLDETGLAKLGTIEIDLSEGEYEDGDRIEFQSDELADYISFCYGINSAQDAPTKFRTSVEKIRNGAIVLRYESGPAAILLYSSDSFGDDADKRESGEEADVKTAKAADSEKEEKEQAEEADELAGHPAFYNPGAEKKPDSKEEKAEAQKRRGEKKEIKELEKLIIKTASRNAGDIKFSLAPEDSAMPKDGEIGVEIGGEASDESEKNSLPKKDAEKPDRRPRLTFEFRANAPADQK